MTTNYDEEATKYEEYTSSENAPKPDTPNMDKAEGKNSDNGWKRVVTGAVSGLVIGSAATALTGMTVLDKPEEGTQEPDDPEPTGNNASSHPEWVDSQVQIATTVSEDMSFGEAFAAARAEVGAGGAFEWHGQIYGTYTAEEWNGMSAEQREEYGSHFNWNKIDHTNSNVTQHPTTDTTTTPADDDIDVISVNHDDNTNDMAQNTPPVQEEPQVQPEEPEVEILGVVHDEETGANIGGMTINGQEVVLIDVDGEGVFDYAVVDSNSNNQVDSDEIIDIQEEEITINDFDGYSNPTGDMFNSNNNVDYTSETIYGD